MTDILQRLANLRIDKYEDDAGNLTAWSEAEPLFCLVRQNEGDLHRAIAEVLRSYVKTFGGGVELSVAFEDAPPPAVPVTKVKPRGRILPRINSREFAAA